MNVSRKITIFLFLILILMAGIFINIRFGKLNSKRGIENRTNQISYPNEEQLSKFERAKIEFKKNPGNRKAAAETLRPYLAVGMSKDDIEEILEIHPKDIVSTIRGFLAYFGMNS